MYVKYAEKYTEIILTIKGARMRLRIVHYKT